ncbi:MAG TPA: glycosyltransferase family 4 protein [Solirubrobacteraceae bacterium]|nr:glycosyltransferase family 4 protein [Solirubrobacteraceae bacterium]
MLLENFTYPEDTRVRNEAESLHAAGHRVTVLAPRGEGQVARETVLGVEVRRYRTVWAGGSPWSYLLEYGVAHLQLLARTLPALLRERCTVHLNGPPDTLAVAGVTARLLGSGVVYDMHDSAPELFAAKFGGGPAGPVLRAVQRAAVACADEVIVTNETQRELAIARCGGSPAKVTIVRNGPRAREFPSPPPARQGALEAPRLVYVGTLDSQDGVLELPEILASPPLAGAHLTVVGDGPAREELLARCRRAGVAERVTFTGRVPHERVAELIADADIGLDPAPGTELNHGSTMIKVAEYMGCGRPLVAYDLRETRLTAGPAALYAPCGRPDAFAAVVGELAGDGERRLQLGRLARERALELTWEHSERALVKVYERLSGAVAPSREARRETRRAERQATSSKAA